MGSSGDSTTASITPETAETNRIFLSVVFAVYLALWVSSLDKYIVGHSAPRLAIPFFSETFNPIIEPSYWSLVPIFIDILSFVVFLCLLVALWWWYGFFLPQHDPRTKFSHYLHDYSTLGAFAIGFQFWGTVDIFLITLCISGFLTGLRLKEVVKRFSKDNEEIGADDKKPRSEDVDPTGSNGISLNVRRDISRLRWYLFWTVGGLTLAIIIISSVLLGLHLADMASLASTPPPSKWSFNYVSIAQLAGIGLIGRGVYLTSRIAKIMERDDGKDPA